MNQPKLYSRYSDVQRSDAKEVIEEFRDKLKWRYDGHDRLIDIGCGSGDILIDILYPILPKNFDNILGIDISFKMIQHARKSYNNYPKCTFNVLDIATNNELPLNIFQQYDHVTSFYCLHWVKNLRQAIKNIYNMLRPEGGDCLLVFLAANPIFDIYVQLRKSHKWVKIMYDVDEFLPPLYFENDPRTFMTDMLKENGFSDIQVEIRDKMYTYKSVEIVLGHFKAICPFLDRLPIKEQGDFLNDFLNICNEMNERREHINIRNNEFTISYKLAVIYAKKNLNNRM